MSRKRLLDLPRHIRDIGSRRIELRATSTQFLCGKQQERTHSSRDPCWTFCRSLSSAATPSNANLQRAGLRGVEECWSCHSSEREPESMFCPSCGVILPVNREQTYHSLLNMEEGSYSIDLKILEQRYKHLQRQLHPDKFSMKSEREKSISEEASSKVNEAYSTLKSPLKHGEYLLEQQGLEAGEGTIDDPEVLASVMGAREAIEDTEDDQVLREYSQTFDEQSKSCIQDLTDAFENRDMEKAQNLVTSLKYISNIRAAILEKL